MTEIKFTCPECGKHRIEEVMANVTVTTEIKSIHELPPVGNESSRVTYAHGKQTNEDGHVDRYQCAHCGETILDHESEETDMGVDACSLATVIKALNKP